MALLKMHFHLIREFATLSRVACQYHTSIISGTALSMTGTNPSGRVFLAIGYEIDLSGGSVMTVDFKVDCN